MSTTHLGASEDLDLFEARRVKQKSSLHANAVGGDTSHGEIGVDSALAHTHHHALEALDALSIALHNAQMYAHRVAHTYAGDIGPGLGIQRPDYAIHLWILPFTQFTNVDYSTRDPSHEITHSGEYRETLREWHLVRRPHPRPLSAGGEGSRGVR